MSQSKPAFLEPPVLCDEAAGQIRDFLYLCAAEFEIAYAIQLQRHDQPPEPPDDHLDDDLPPF